MVIKQIHLKNFRLFDDITVDFDERLNVFLGVNGAGKSALLDAVAIMLSYSSISFSFYWIPNTIVHYKTRGVYINSTFFT